MRRLALAVPMVLLATACGPPPPPPEAATTVAEVATTTSAAALAPNLYECVATESIVDRIESAFGPAGVLADAPTAAVRGEIEVTVASLKMFRDDASAGVGQSIDDLIESLEATDQQIGEGGIFPETVARLLDQAAATRIDVVRAACEQVDKPVPIMVEHTNPNPTWAVLDFTFEEPIEFGSDAPHYLFEIYFDSDGSYVDGTDLRDEEGYVSFRSAEDGLSIDVIAQAGVSQTLVAASGDNEIGDIDEWIGFALQDESLRVEILQPIAEDDPSRIITKTRITWSASDAFPAVGEWIRVLEVNGGG